MHSLIKELRNKSKVSFLDMVEEVSKEIKNNYKSIGILSTSKTREDKLYDNKLKGIKIYYPSISQQEIVSKIIIRIIRNKSTEQDKKFLEEVIDSLIKRGAEKVLLACTDLANIIKENNKTIDSSEILIKVIKLNS